MLKAIEIENFRGFKNLRMELAPVNLISGKNNTGKTAILEAIFLQMGPLQPQLATSFSHRGEGRSSISILPPGLRYIDEWKLLFFDREITRPCHLSSELVDGSRQTLSIELRESNVQVIEPATQSTAQASEIGQAITQESSFELAYTFSGPNDTLAETVATPSQIGGGIPRERLRIEKVLASRPSLPKATLLGTDRQPRAQLAQQFSRLRENQQHGPIEEVLRRLEPRLRTIEIRVEAQRPELAADIGLTQLMPLRMMGEGVTRLVEILLAIFGTREGIVLIDEIENGLHYSVLSDVWDSTIRAARLAQVQLIATTHSFECIRAAHQAADINPPYELRLHRVDRTNGSLHATIYDREKIEASLAMGLEVR
jgi:predicted ATPase